MNSKVYLKWILRIVILFVLYLPIWILGALALGNLVPNTPSEPGLVNEASGTVVLGIINTLLIVGVIMSSKWRGWKLALLFALAYYGAFTFITQIETWYFLSDLTVSVQLLPRLFLMGLSIPLIYIPLSIWICGRWKQSEDVPEYQASPIRLRGLIPKFGILGIVYLVIYWLAGYFIAWQNPELRAFYGSPGEIVPFWTHTMDTFRASPSLIVFQFVRGLLFVGISLPIIYGSKLKSWQTGLLLAFFLATPHLVHILPNPLMPLASVRLSHMLETYTSTFVFGLIVVWLLNPRQSNPG